MCYFGLYSKHTKQQNVFAIDPQANIFGLFRQLGISNDFFIHFWLLSPCDLRQMAWL